MLSEKKVEMFARVAEWKRSSMSIVAFAQTCGIGERKFYYWAQKVRETAMSADNNPEFIEIGQLVKADQLVKPSPLGETETESVKFTTPKIELVFPSGLCVKIYA